MEYGKVDLVYFTAEFGTNETTFAQPSRKTVVYPWYPVEMSQAPEFSDTGTFEWRSNDD